MSLIFGGGSKTKPQFTGLAAQTSTSAVPITVVWGQNRVAPNIIWQGDFKAKKKKQGKGGGKGATTYTYSASFQLGICWGEAHDIVTVWKDDSKVKNNGSSLPGKAASKTYNYFLGTTPQDPWGYLVSRHPSEALGYPGIVHVDMANYDLGQTNQLGQHSFEVQALRWKTGVGGTVVDADPALVVEDFLSSDQFGIGFDMSVIANLYSSESGIDSSYQTYCRAMGFAFSPILASQEAGNEILSRWAKITNTAVTWNGYEMKFFPRGPDQVTANGVTYVPDFPVRYRLSDRDYITNDSDPITFERVDPADAYNSLSMIIANRANEYNELPVPWRDQGLVDQFGLRKDDDLNAQEICETSMAEVVVALIGQRTAYVRNTFSFTLPISYCLLEPMDILVVYDPRWGDLAVEIQSVEEDEDENLKITADEYIESISLPTANTSGSVVNTPINTGLDPGPVNTPIFFEPPSSLASTAQLWIAVSGGDNATADTEWGGAIVWVSTDGDSYVQVGEVEGAARMGVLSAALSAFAGPNPDTQVMKVDLTRSAGELEDEASAFDAQNGQNLVYTDGEFIGFEVPTMTSSYQYDITGLWRGLYGSEAKAHASGSPWTFVDDMLFKYELPAEYVGKTLYLKFQSANAFQTVLQDLAECVAYTYTPVGTGYGSGEGGTPATVTGISGSAGAGYNRLTWAAASANDNVTTFDILRATGSGADVSTATKIASVGGTTTDYTDVTAVANQPYTYFVVAVNAAGSSEPSVGTTLSSSNTGGTLWRVNAVGTGVAQAITLPYADVDPNGVFVYGNGFRYTVNQYTIVGTTLTITTNAAGDVLEIIGTVQ